MSQGFPVANTVVLNYEINAFMSAIHYPETAVEKYGTGGHSPDGKLSQLLERFRHSQQANLLGPRSSHPTSICATKKYRFF